MIGLAGKNLGKPHFVMRYLRLGLAICACLGSSGCKPQIPYAVVDNQSTKRFWIKLDGKQYNPVITPKSTIELVKRVYIGGAFNLDLIDDQGKVILHRQILDKANSGIENGDEYKFTFTDEDFKMSGQGNKPTLK